ncbi:MAG: IS66 family transposase [Planctomycetota bacterium]|jgi:transposase
MTADKIQAASREKLVEALLISQSRVTELENELSYLKRQLFGSKSERFIPANPDQTILPLILPAKESDSSRTKEDISYTRNKKQDSGKTGHSRETMPTHLPIEDIRIEPEEDMTGCSHIGDDITWEYEYKRGKLIVKRYIRPKYAKKEGTSVITGKMPPRPVEKGNFGPGFIANLINEKYNYHIPLDRQRKRFLSENNVSIAESTLCDIVRQGCFWFEPLYQKLIELLLKASYLQADETPIPVLVRDGRGKTHRGYFWVYFDPVSNIIVFDYRMNRSREGPNNFLEKFKGIVQVDGYQGYTELLARSDIQWAACMAHVRRKFDQALETDKERGTYALKEIGLWFEWERQSKEDGLNPADRLAMRKDHVVPSMESFHSWLNQESLKVLPKSLIGKAIGYALNQWPGFTPFMTDGRVELSNNLVENAIRPVALGRKNYLFKGSHAAAQRAAVIYSLISTATRHGHDSFRYLKDVLTRLPASTNKQLDGFLPQNWTENNGQ